MTRQTHRRIARNAGVALLAMSLPAMAAKTTVVGGAQMYPSKNIIANAVNSEDHETLVAAVKAADLVDTLQTQGPFTVFAPTDQAFAALPDGTVDTLLEPENKERPTDVLTYHVIPGRLTADLLVSQIRINEGQVRYATLSEDVLSFSLSDGSLIIEDEAGNTAAVTIADVAQSNGVIHVVDTVLLP